MAFSFIVFCVLTIVGPYLHFSLMSAKAQNADFSKVKIIGHRGFAAYAPENTLASFRRCLTMQSQMIELDVHLSSDDSVMVIHDHTVDRTSNGKGHVENLTYNQLKKLDAGIWFCENFNDERIPELSEVLELVNGQRTVLIELKWPQKGIYKGLVAKVIELVRKYKAEQWVIIQSFEPLYLKEVSQLAPDLVTHQLIYGAARFLPIYYDRTFHLKKFKPLIFVKAVNCNYLYATKRFVKKMHNKNLSVNVYTVNKPKFILRLAGRGVDGIITDNALLAERTLYIKE